MLEQIRDLREEGDELYELLKTLEEADWGRATPFKSWTVQDVVEHLHFSDRLAVLSLKSDEEFMKVAADMGKAIAGRRPRSEDLLPPPARVAGTERSAEALA